MNIGESGVSGTWTRRAGPFAWLRLRHCVLTAAFVCPLLWQYLREGPLHGYATVGYGPYLVVKRDAPDEKIGICGLIYRPTLDLTDLGYSLLPRHYGHGYATGTCCCVVGCYFLKTFLEWFVE